MFLMENGLSSNRNIDLRMVMVQFGFDFSLMGSIYIYEMLVESLSNPNVIRNENIPTMTMLADKHNIKIKTFNRDIRWSIDKAYKNGMLKYVPYFEELTSSPPTKQVLSWLFNYLIMQNAN